MTVLAFVSTCWWCVPLKGDLQRNPTARTSSTYPWLSLSPLLYSGLHDMAHGLCTLS